MIRDYFSLSFRTLKRRGVRSWLTMLGIFIGIASVVSLISLGQGLQSAVTGQFSTLSPDRLIIQNAGTGFGPPGSTSVDRLHEHDSKLIEKVNGVEIVIPRLVRVVNVKYNKIGRFEYATSIPDNQNQAEEIYKSFNLRVEEGRLLEVSDRGKVVLGNDYVDVQRFEKDIRVGSKLEIQGKEFEVVGILKAAGSFQVNSVVFMAEEDLKDIFDIGDEIDLIAVRVESVDNVEKISEDIKRKLREDRDEDLGEESFSVQTPVQALSTVNTVLFTINAVIIGIAALSLIVGGIGITNTMYTSVLERTREIGVMKAIGARNRDVMTLFLIESGLLGLAGGVIGAVLGLALAFGVSSIAGAFLGGINLEINLSWPLLIGAIGFSFLVGMFSGVMPAIQASRLNTVEALRS